MSLLAFQGLLRWKLISQEDWERDLVFSWQGARW